METSAAHAALDAAAQELQCPICLCVATDPVALAGCGHLACSECISEWLSRQRNCPTCRHVIPVGPGDVLKVHALDGLLSRLSFASELLQRAQVEQLLSSTASGGDSSSRLGSVGEAADATGCGAALECVYKDSLHSALSITSGYVSELRVERDAAKAFAARSYEAALAVARRLSVDGAVPSADALAAARDAATHAADAEYARAYGALVEETRAFVATAAIPLTLLPTNVHIFVPALALRFDVRLRCFDTVESSIVPAVARTVFETTRLDLVTYSTISEWLVAPCFAPADAAVTAAAVAAAAVPALPSAEEVPGSIGALPSSATPILLDIATPIYTQCIGGRPLPGTTIYCRGAVTATSARLGKCICATWSAGTRDDYYRCDDCKISWICSACAESCHRSAGHRCTPFIMAHLPTFACCYCKTRNTAGCKIASIPGSAS